jgi:spore germination protein YaaH
LPGSGLVAGDRAGGLEAAIVAPPSPTPPSPLSADQLARQTSAEVYAYLPYWEFDGGTDAYIRYERLTDLALFSVTTGRHGALNTAARGYATVTGELAAGIVRSAHAAGVRVDLTMTSFGLQKNAAFFGDPAAMSTAVRGLADLVVSEGLDGVNIDVEELENAYFDEYGEFVAQVHRALVADNPAARVSVATNAGISGAGMARLALANGAHRAFIMGYAYRTGGTGTAGAIAPLIRADGGKSLNWTLDLYEALAVPADRLLLGLPWYGQSWYTTSAKLHAQTAGSAGFFFPGDELADVPAGVTIQHDRLEGTAWFAVQDPTSGTWTQTYFDDPETLSSKYALAAKHGLAGVGIWTLGYDRGTSGYWETIPAKREAPRPGGV